MKYLLFAISSSLMIFGAQAQSLEVTFNDSVAYGHPTNTNDIEAKAYVRNNSATDMNVKVKRYFDRSNDLVDSNAICWGFCFDADVDVSPLSIEIKAGQTDNFNFSGHVYPDMDGVLRNGEVKYTFFDSEDENDSVSMIIRYETIATFSSNIQVAQVKTAGAYPNPANEFFTLNFERTLDRNAHLIITDMLGNVVKRVHLNAGNRQYRINTNEMRSGMYLYSLDIDGQKQFTKRISIVKR